MSFDEIWRGVRAWRACINDVQQNAYDSVVARHAGAGREPHADHRSESAIRGRAGTGSGGRQEPARKTGSIVAHESVHRRNSGDGELSDLRSQRASRPATRSPGARSNLAITTPFEPGSVFKVITLAAALETTNLTPDTMINCGNGTIKLFGRVIHDHTPLFDR